MVDVLFVVRAPLRWPLVPDGHDEHDALHDGRQHIHAPGAPAAPAKARCQTAGKQEPSRRLDAHH